MKIYLLFVCLSLFTTLTNAQEAKDLFVNMPDSFTPLLTATNKADFIDFLESNMKAEVKNKFENISEMTDLSADFIHIKMTEQSSWQMKLLNINDSTSVICIVSTACAPACDSSVQFFTPDWKEVPANTYIELPALNDFIQSPEISDPTDFNNLLLKMDMLLMQAGLSKEDNTLTFAITTPQYMEKEDAEELSPYLKSPILYKWRDGSFVR